MGLGAQLRAEPQFSMPHSRRTPGPSLSMELRVCARSAWLGTTVCMCVQDGVLCTLVPLTLGGTLSEALFGERAW